MEKLTPEEALDRLKDLQKSGDQEVAHYEADRVLLQLLRFYGCPEGVINAYADIGKWYA